MRRTGGDGSAALAAAIDAIEAIEAGGGGEGESAVLEVLTREILAASFVGVETNAPPAANQPVDTHLNDEGTR